MADRVYPSSKPAAAPGGGNPAFPANKAQLYNTTRPLYRPQPRPRRRGRSCCCSFCLFITFVLILLLLLAAVSGAVLYILYRPHRPSFTVSSLRISQFNLTSSSQLNSKFNLTIAARNPNKKLKFYYDPISIAITADGVDVGDGSIPAFVHGTKNTTTLRSTITSSQSIDSGSIGVLRSDLKSNNGVDLKIQLDTKVRVKIGGLKTKKVPIRVSCKGIKAVAPTGKSPTTATTADAKCKVDVRIKIWKWTI